MTGEMQRKMPEISDFLEGVRTVAIAGHVHPDGDCIGSCMGLYLYLQDNYPQIRADVYLEEPRKEFFFLKGLDGSLREAPEKVYDLVILLDISSRERIGVAGHLAETAEKTLCIDHHRTNKDNYTWLYNYPEVSSASEVLYGFLDHDRISKECAEALYLGIAHDTGIFQYSSTSPRTMRIAAALMEKGIAFSRIIDDTYYQKTFLQNVILGYALSVSGLYYDGRLIVSLIAYADMLRFGAAPSDMDGIVNHLRNTKGTEAAVLLYENEPGVFKVSLRSRERADVSRVAAQFGGGGHIRAAGCTMRGPAGEVLEKLTAAFGKELAAASGEGPDAL